MTNSIQSDPKYLEHPSDKTLTKQVKKILERLERSHRQGKDSPELEAVYWVLQHERLKRLKGKRY